MQAASDDGSHSNPSDPFDRRKYSEAAGGELYLEIER
jgi:hypothetical protein